MERLILCGGGHVSLELAHIAARLEFEVVVIDDRPEFASETRFPMVQQVLCLPFEQALDQLGSRDTDFYAILTGATPLTRSVWPKSCGGGTPMWA